MTESTFLHAQDIEEMAGMQGIERLVQGNGLRFVASRRCQDQDSPFFILGGARQNNRAVAAVRQRHETHKRYPLTAPGDSLEYRRA